MGAAAALGAAAAAASLGSTISGAVGGTGSPSSGFGTGVPYYTPSSPGLADYNYIQAMNNYQTGIGGLESAFQGAPGQQAITGANQASAYGTGTLAPMQQQGAAALQQSGMSALPYGQQILSTAFDPQNELYNRTQQQVQDQTQAQLAMAGLSSSPYGAGLASEQLADFNINWQNNLLGRQVQGASGYNSLNQAAGQDFSGASALGTAGAGSLSTYSGLPFSTIYGMDTNILNALTGEGNLSGQYLGLGNQATQIGAGLQNQAFNQAQTVGQNTGAALQQLGNVFGGSNINLGSLGNLFGGYSVDAPGFMGGSYDAGATTYAPSQSFYDY